MLSSSLVSTIAGSGWFRAGWAPFVLLDTDLRIREVSPTFERVVGYARDQVLEQHLFEAFPDNPSNPRGAQANVSASLEEVLRTGRRQWMGVQRYDVPDPEQHGTFVHRAWIPLNLPVTEDGLVVGVLSHSQDVTVAMSRATADAVSSYRPEEMDSAAEALLHQFPWAASHLVLTVLTHSQQQVFEAAGRPDLAKAVEMARLRLEVRTGRAAGPTRHTLQQP